jgi:hypothetical protein
MKHGGPLFWVGKTWEGPRNAAEGEWGWFSWYAKGSWFDLSVPFPIPPIYPDALLFHTLSNTPLPFPKTLWWVVYGWHVVVGGGGREKIGGSAPKSSAITPRTYGVFNYISVYLLRSTLQKLFKLLKIFIYILDT